MNIFIIPSWYPSADRPLTGIFIKEQVMALAALYPRHNFGISLWGQMTDENLLWAAQPFKSLLKYLKYNKRRVPDRKLLLQNCTEYYSPALSWSRKWRSGNLKKIIEANEQNLQAFQAEYGEVDLLHAHVAYPGGWLAMELSQKAGIPFLITEHSGPFPMPGFGDEVHLDNLYRKPLSNAGKIIAVSSFLANELNRYQLPSSAVIPNMVDECLFKPAAVEKNDAFMFFCLGRLSYEKGTDLLLQAIALEKLFFENQRVSFVIGGSGTQENQMKQLAKDLGIAHIINWLGSLSRTEAAAWHNRSHAFVLPSRLESFGIVCAEAMACGKPVIATRCGGPEDIVTPKTGLLLDKDNVEQLAEAMVRVVKGWHQYSPKEIRSYFLDHFSRPVVAGKLVDLYEKLVSE